MLSLGGNCSIAYQLRKNGIRKEAYPFDWCKMTSKQLLTVLKNNFEDFEKLEIKKHSKFHPYIDDLDNDAIGTLILKNKYGVQFAHELRDKSELDLYCDKIKTRINRFKELDNPTLIRIETQNLNNKKMEIYKEIEEELTKYFTNYKLILISKEKYESNKTIWHPLEFTEDWTYSNLDWNIIFN